MNNRTHNIIIFAGQPSGPEVIERNNHRTTLIHAPNPTEAADQAANFATGDVDRIDLCGGTGAKWLAAVRSAVDEDVPVELVTYPFESLTEIAAFKARHETGASDIAEGEAIIFLSGRVKSNHDRVVQSHESGWTVYAAAQDEEEALEIAGELANKGATLFGGFDFNTAAKIIDRTKGKVPVGVATI